MVQITIGGDVKLSKTHFESVEELKIELGLIELPQYQVPEEHKKILEALAEEAKKDKYSGLSREEFNTALEV
ncbi:hypothetical protein EZY14_007340 [Kordia sp. TARA_039_SRF]|nr:hypothetical protein EZY14_007340 [Kordia sp. TARA_039_SRF]